MLQRTLRFFSTARERLDFDLVIVGAGPCGLSAAVRAKQLAPDLSVCVVEKGATVGAHILSGNIFDPRSFRELFPDRKFPGFMTPVTDERFEFLSSASSVKFPEIFLPAELHNSGNFIMSLGEFCEFLGSEAETLGAEIFPGFAAAGAVYEDGRVVGVYTRDVGVDKAGKQKSTFSPGVELRGKHVIVAEGAKGSLATELIEKFDLAKDKCPQKYSLGFKETWEIKKSKNFRAGSVVHTVGFPLNGSSEYGGGFIYFKSDTEVHLGLVVGLDYPNPLLNPYEQFQKWKTHPYFREILAEGECRGYGARVINTGGLQALPRLEFPGGVLAGCAAGFLNVPRIKGTHLAMKTGMLAAEAAVEGVVGNFQQKVENSWVWSEMHKVRNCKPAFKRGGLFGGLLYSGLSLLVFRGKEPWTFGWTKKDWQETQAANDSNRSQTGTAFKPDGRLTFALMENVARTNVNHGENQQSHLRIKSAELVAKSIEIYDGPEQRFCPAGVYEYPDGRNLVVNAQNCIHCKTCAIKTPFQFVEWTVPEGGDGPNYSRM